MDWRLSSRPKEKTEDHRGGTLVSPSEKKLVQQPSVSVSQADEVACEVACKGGHACTGQDLGSAAP